MPAAIIELQPARSESSASLALTAPTTIPLNPARAESLAALALTTPATIPLNPARSESSASLRLFTRASRLLQALRGTPTEQTAAHVHPHDWHLPESMLDAPLLAAAAVAAVAWRFSRRLRLR